MKWIEKIKGFLFESKSENNDFNSLTAPATNSNFYEFRNDLDAANVAAHLKTGDYFNTNKSPTLTDIDNFINERTLGDWFLLQLQANYYINTINFECEDSEMYEKIKQVIWGAFIYGKAGLYFNEVKNEWRVVLINNLEVESRKILKAYVTDLTIFNEQINLTTDNYQIIINEKEIDNLFIFRWGVTSQSALVYQMPFIKTQNMIFTQLTISALLLGKKVTEKVDARDKSLSEISTWMNPKKFFVRLKFDQKSSDKIEIIEKDLTNNVKEIDFYKEFENRWYSLFGRRVNTDFKKERQVSGEVDLTQDNFNVLENEWKSQFYIFIKKLKGKGVNINYEFGIDSRDDKNNDNPDSNVNRDIQRDNV